MRRNDGNKRTISVLKHGLGVLGAVKSNIALMILKHADLSRREINRGYYLGIRSARRTFCRFQLIALMYRTTNSVELVAKDVRNCLRIFVMC